MPQFRRFRRPRRGPRNKPHWTASTGDVTVAGGATNATVILVRASTFALGVSLEQEILLHRMVGWVNVKPTLAAAAAGGTVGLGILFTQNATVVAGGFNDPLVTAELASKDWMRILTTEVPFNAGANAWMQRQYIDIRVKRKMKDIDAVMCAIHNLAGGDSMIVSFDIRSLVSPRL